VYSVPALIPVFASFVVPAWDESDNEDVTNGDNVIAKRPDVSVTKVEFVSSESTSKALDSWDAEYDKGRLKKIKAKKQLEQQQENPFQTEFDQTRHQKAKFKHHGKMSPKRIKM
jgi:hypothetical protein